MDLLRTGHRVTDTTLTIGTAPPNGSATLARDILVDPNAIHFTVTSVHLFRIGVKRSGSTAWLISTDLAFRKEGVTL